MNPTTTPTPPRLPVTRDVIAAMRGVARASNVQLETPAQARAAQSWAAQVKVRECAALAVQNPAEADFYYRLAATVWTQHLLDVCVGSVHAQTIHVRITGLGVHLTSPERRAVEEWVDELLTDGAPEAVRRLVDTFQDAA